MVKCKCSECGYAGFWDKASQRFVIATMKSREKGGPPDPGHSHTAYELTPTCGVGAENGKPVDLSKSAERECLAFKKWVPALSVKEHLDVHFLEEQAKQARLAEESRKAWLDKQATDHEKQRKADEAWRITESNRAESVQTANLRINFALMVGTIIAAFFTGWAATHPTVIPVPTPVTQPDAFGNRQKTLPQPVTDDNRYSTPKKQADSATAPNDPGTPAKPKGSAS